LKKENELLKECNIRNYTGRRNTDDMNLKLLNENKKLKEENERLKEVYDACNIDSINRAFKIGNLEMENKKLKESLDIATKCSSKEED
jgi:LPS O-antigen subunit length determinant protein (WzzB/FepE family)